MNQTITTRRTNKKNRSESVGKIVSNKNQKERQPLTNLPFQPFINLPLQNNKKEQLRLKYNKIVEDYEKKSIELDHQMKMLEKNTIKQDCKKKKLKDYRKDYKIFQSDRNEVKQENITLNPIGMNFGSNFASTQFNVKKVQQDDHKKQNNFILFIKMLQQQIRLQKQLRKWKSQINKLNEKNVQQLLEIKQSHITKDMIILQLEQFDPFLELEDIELEILVDNLIKNIEICDKHWMSLKGILTTQQINDLFKKLDFQRKGVLNLKVFGREISIITNNNYRDRDLFKIWKRIALGKDSITVSQLEEGLTKDD